MPPDEHFLGDAAFPLSLGLMKPYGFNPGFSAEQKYFDFKLSSMRMSVECLFGMLKSRFRALAKGLEFRSVERCNRVITACVFLHNFIMTKARDNDSIFFDDAIFDEIDWYRPNRFDPDSTEEYFMSLDSADGDTKRNLLCSLLWNSRSNNS